MKKSRTKIVSIQPESAIHLHATGTASSSGRGLLTYNQVLPGHVYEDLLRSANDRQPPAEFIIELGKKEARLFLLLWVRRVVPVDELLERFIQDQKAFMRMQQRLRDKIILLGYSHQFDVSLDRQVRHLILRKYFPAD